MLGVGVSLTLPRRRRETRLAAADRLRSNARPPPSLATPDGPAPKMQILKRPDANRSASASSSGAATPAGKSLTQREEEYRLARERIFGPGGGDDGASASAPAASGSTSANAGAATGAGSVARAPGPVPSQLAGRRSGTSTPRSSSTPGASGTSSPRTTAPPVDELARAVDRLAVRSSERDASPATSAGSRYTPVQRPSGSSSGRGTPRGAGVGAGVVRQPRGPTAGAGFASPNAGGGFASPGSGPAAGVQQAYAGSAGYGYAQQQQQQQQPGAAAYAYAYTQQGQGYAAAGYGYGYQQAGYAPQQANAAPYGSGGGPVGYGGAGGQGYGAPGTRPPAPYGGGYHR